MQFFNKNVSSFFQSTFALESVQTNTTNSQRNKLCLGVAGVILSLGLLAHYRFSMNRDVKKRDENHENPIQSANINNNSDLDVKFNNLVGKLIKKIRETESSGQLEDLSLTNQVKYLRKNWLEQKPFDSDQHLNFV